MIDFQTGGQQWLPIFRAEFTVSLLRLAVIGCLVCGWQAFGASVQAEEKWPFAADPAANHPKWENLEGKQFEPTGPIDLLRPVTGGAVVMTGHATGSTTRQVWSLTDFTLQGTLNGRLDVNPGTAALSPDGKLLALAKKKNFTSLGLEIWSVDESKKLKALDLGPASERVVWCGFLSPERVVTLHETEQGQSRLRVVDIAAGKPPTEIALSSNVDSRFIGVSPGGRLFAGSTKSKAIVVVDLTDGKPHKPFNITVPAGYGTCAGLQFSPDGTELGALFAASEKADQAGDVGILAWNLADGQPAVQIKQVHVETAGPATADKTIAFDWLPDGSAFLIGYHTLINRDTGHVVWRLQTAANLTAAVPPLLLGTDYLLLPPAATNNRGFQTLKLPWKEIDSGLKALQANSPAWLRPGDKLSLQFEFGGLRFLTQDQLKSTLTTELKEVLRDAQFEIADGQPVTLKIAYAESAGTTLQKRNDDFPFPRPPRFPRRPFPGFRGTADGNMKGTGTGFVIHPDGYLLTCAHVVGSAVSVDVKLGDATYHGRVLAKNVLLDFALLKIEGKNLATLPLSDSTKIELGEEVRAIGYPISSLLGESIKATRGTLAGLVKKDNRTMFQVDASINPGNSGGPLVNDKGEVVGITSAKLVGAEVDNVGFSIPINEVKAMLKEQKVTFQTAGSKTALAGPDLIKRVTPAVALITSTGGADVAPDGVSSVVVTRIACLLSLLVKDNPEPVWVEQIVVEPSRLRVMGQLTEQKARDMAYEMFLQRLENISWPYFISKDAQPVTLPVITDLTIPVQEQAPVTPRKTRRGMSN